MKPQFYKIFLIQLLLSFSFLIGLAQIEVQVSKVACSKKDGHFLRVNVKNNGRILDSTWRNFYNFPCTYRLNDSIKIRIIESLLKFASDSSLCCRKVNMYYNPDYAGCFNIWPASKYFSIRVEALFIINRIAYNPLTFRIGCYPVLFDTKTKREINGDNSLIDIMVERYKKWFKMYKEMNKLPDYRFLNMGRIRWW